ncbi:MAG TPA: penicillin-binding transpeptidase domain-containing protein [bacterium]|nr:penicillin-binding transpeptidase domain-containing protein [bacterium]
MTALGVAVAVVLTALLMRLIEVQLVQGGRLQRMAQRQQLATILLQPHRGRVLDRRGRPLAINVEVPSIYAVPSAIPDRRAFAERAAPILGLSTDDVLRRLQTGRHFAWLARKVPTRVAEQLRSLDLTGQIGIRMEDRRAYPNGKLAAHLLGFTGIDSQGLAGIELAYDGTLRGRAGKALAEQDGVGRVLVETQRVVESPEDGADLLLTIDQVIQHVTERELETAMQRTHARRGSVIVMDPRSGEILALAVRPAFDPNTGTDARPELWLNRTVAGVYEPGSTFKVFTAAAALDSGVVSPKEKFLCNGSLRVPGGHIIREAINRKLGWLTIAGIIRNSCNVGAAQVATRLGKPLFHRYIRAFGFGAPSGVDLPGELPGLVPPPSAWLGPGLQTIAFGQGISVTPLQLLTAATALTNDGMVVRPHVVRGRRDREGRTTAVVGPLTTRRAIRPETATAVLEMMIGTVENGTGRLAAIDGYVVAGKTGTAQKPGATGGYDPGRYIASFLGILPAGDPALALLVILDEPLGAYFGGAVAAPVFREIASQTLWYLRIPPSASAGGRP